MIDILMDILMDIPMDILMSDILMIDISPVGYSSSFWSGKSISCTWGGSIGLEVLWNQNTLTKHSWDTDWKKESSLI